MKWSCTGLGMPDQIATRCTGQLRSWGFQEGESGCTPATRSQYIGPEAYECCMVLRHSDARMAPSREFLASKPFTTHLIL